MRVDDLRRRGQEGAHGYGYASGKESKGSTYGDRKGRRQNAGTPIPLRDVDNTNVVQYDARQGEDAESMSSQTRIIIKTNSYTVETEPRAPEESMETRYHWDAR